MPDDIATMSYEAALAELDGIIARLERGDVELEAAISAYERGTALARHCAGLLDRTEQKITQLVVGAAGDVERPFVPPGERLERAGPAAPPPEPTATTAGERLFGEAAAPVPAAGAPIDPDAIPF